MMINKTYNKIKPIPSPFFSSCSLFKNNVNINADTNKNTEEIKNGIIVIPMGWIIATIPMISPMFVKTPPVKSPIAISLYPILIALIPKTNSGSVVAKDNRKSPMIICGKFKSTAIKEAK